MSNKNVKKAGIAIGLILCLVFTSLLVFPAVSAEDEETKIVGLVKDTAGFPIDSGVVTLTNIHTGETMSVEVSKGETYSFTVEPGFYVVKAEGEYYLDTGDGVSDIVMVLKGETKRVQDLKLKKMDHSVEVTGYVLDDMGKGVANATITAYSTDAAFKGYEVMATAGHMGNETGLFTLDLYYGAFDLYATIEGYEYAILPVTVNASSTAFNLTILEEGDPATTISGYAMDTDTLDYIPGVRAWAYDVNNDRYIESSYSGGSYFEIKVYNGIFNLIVDTPGYLTFVNNSIVIDTNVAGKEYALVNAEMEKDLDEELDTTLSLSDDFQTLTLTQKWVITSESAIYGLDLMNMGSPRMQIDNALGDGNGVVSAPEANAFKTWLKNAGPHYLYTDGFFEVNDTAFGPTDPLQYTITDFVGIEGPVDSTNQMYVRTKMVYEILEPLDEGASEYKIELLDKRGNEEIDLQINDTWEILNTPEDDWYMFSFETVPETLKVYKRSAPVAKIEVVNSEDLFQDTDENETLIKYIVKAKQNITLRSKSTDDVGTIVNTTWMPGEGIAPMYDSEVTFQYQNAGIHTAKLTVTDSSGMTDSASVKFLVDVEAPVITLRIENETKVLTEPYEQDEETTITFYADGTYDAAFGDDLTYIWTFGDESSPVQGMNTTHAFQKPGTYDITLEVKDPLGHNATETVTNFKIKDTTNPWAVITFDPQPAFDMGAEFELNASQSYDDDWDEETKYDQIKSYEWDFDYNDDLEDADNFTVDGTGKILKHTYERPGTYTIMLRVTDMSDNVGETTRLVEVNGPNLAIGMAPKISPAKDIKVGDDVTFTVNVTNNGPIDARNVTVRIYYSEINDNYIIGDETIPLLRSQQAINITIKWEAHQGGKGKDKEKFPILYVVDPDDAIGETSEEDNQWEQKIQVKPNTVIFIVLGIIAGILVVIIVAYVVYRKFFGPEEEDEDRSERRRKAGRKKDDDDDDDDEEDGIGGKVKGFFKKGDDDDDDDDEDDD